MTTDAAPHPFRIADFRFYWAARLTSTLAQNAMVVVIGWQVYDIARQTMDQRAAAMQLGYIGLVQFVPLLLLTLVVGWTADRLDRRWIARAAVLLEAACAIALALLTWYDKTTLADLFIVAGLLGVARAFASPALQALAPNLVPRGSLPAAIALSSIAWQAGAIAGPALGGLLYAVKPHLPYTLAAALFILALTSLLLIRPVPRPVIDTGASPWRRMGEGLGYVRKNRLILGAISLDLFAVLLGGVTAMLPIYARDILAVGPIGVGALRMAPAVGAVLVALWFSARPLRTNVGVKMLWGVGVFSLSTIAFGFSRWMPFSLACLVLLGAADMFSVYVRQSLVQLHTPDAMRGRVGAVSTLFVSASNELGEARSGFFAALVGPVAAVVLGGAGAVAVTMLWAKYFPELRRARTFDPPGSIR